MCFHISISKSKNQVSDRFKIAFEDLDYKPIFHLNGFSNQKCYVIPITNKNKLTSAVWGLKPADFSATDNFNLNTLNAKSETVFNSPLYRKPILENRCLLIADGFFESKQVNGKKYPHFIHLQNKPLFAFAGIYNHHKDGTISCAMLTTKANDFMADIHNTKKRMPIILEETFEETWLDETLSENDINDVLQTGFTKTELAAYTVSKSINNTRVDSNSPEALQPFYYQELHTLF